MNPEVNPAVAATARSHSGPIETDAVIVGAGPVGLFQVFELGLLEIKAHVIDSLAYPGGQCVELYPDKPIYDIPAVPMCTGQELTDNLLKQIEPFGATFHYGQEVTQVQKQDDGRFFVQTSKGTQFISKTVFIAGGVGSFQPRTLKVDGLEKFEDTQLFTACATRRSLRARTWSSWAVAIRHWTGRWTSSRTARTRPRA
jgi:thioredoxin reductase (NADPH)